MITKPKYRACSSKQFLAVMPQIVLLSLLLVLAGCARLESGRKTLANFNLFAANKADTTSKLTPYDLQLELMRYADEYSNIAGEIADGLLARAKNAEERVWPLSMKIAQANAAVSIASNPNPLCGIMDMVVLVTLTRSTLESYFIPKVFGEEARGAVERYRKAEDDAWQLAARVLDSKQLNELRKSIDRWLAENPDQHYVSFVRLQNLYKPEPARADKPKSHESIFGLLLLDPFAGLDPAAREIEMSRHTTERALYQLQRMPQLLDWQLSFMVSKLLAMPEIRNLLSAADRISTAAEALPRKITEERVAIVKDLDASAPKLQTLLIESRKTLEACSNAANAVDETVKALNSFVARFDKDATVATTSSQSARPFDVTEYGASAAQIAAAARELNVLVNSVDQKLSPRAQEAIGRAKSVGTELVDYVFLRAVAFVLITLAGIVVAVFVFRTLAMRFPKVK